MTKQELLRKADEYKVKLAELKGDNQESLFSIEGVNTKGTELMLSLVKKGELAVTEEVLRVFQTLGSIDCEGTGQYRTERIQPVWAKHTPPAPEDLDHYMGHFIGQMKISRQMFHPIEFAAICHKRVLEIYPFKTGNEEVVMLVLNLILLGNGYEGIRDFSRQEEVYLDKLVKSQHPNQPDIDGFIAFIAACEIEAQREKYLELNGI